jgi:hypothetical protein
MYGAIKEHSVQAFNSIVEEKTKQRGENFSPRCFVAIISPAVHIPLNKILASGKVNGCLSTEDNKYQPRNQ